MINTLIKHVSGVFVQLQSDNFLVSQQKIILENLAVDICAHTRVEGSYSEDIIVVEQGSNLVFGRFSISHESVIEVIYDQGLFIRKLYDNLNSVEQNKVICAVGNFVLSIVNGIIVIQAEKDCQNRYTDDVPPVLPHELVKLRMRDFGLNVLARHLSQLSLTWTESQIAQIERDHRELCEAYQRDRLVQSRLKECDHNTTFKADWAIVDGKYSALRDFCGGIATVFANTASVESDFSILE